MTSLPLISVIIPAYNAEATIVEAVESVLAQTYRPLEVIVIDDGSSDATVACVENKYENVRVIRQSNAGPSSARNHGIREAKGSWIAFLDADDRWLPEKLTQQWGDCSADPSIGLVHTDVMFFEPNTDRQWQTKVGRENYVGTCTDELLKANRILTSSVLVDRNYLDQTELFDEQFWVAEDYDLWLRLSALCKFAYIPDPLVEYRMQGESLSTQSLRMRKSELAVFQKALSTLYESSRGDSDNPFRNHQLRSRLLELNWDIGSLAFEQNQFAEARPYLGQTIKLKPWNLRAWYLWLSTWLPERLAIRLRQWKQGFGSSTRQAIT